MVILKCHFKNSKVVSYDKRTEAEVYTKEELDVTELMQWLEKQNKN